MRFLTTFTLSTLLSLASTLPSPASPTLYLASMNFQNLDLFDTRPTAEEIKKFDLTPERAAEVLEKMMSSFDGASGNQYTIGQQCLGWGNNTPWIQDIRNVVARARQEEPQQWCTIPGGGCFAKTSGSAAVGLCSENRGIYPCDAIDKTANWVIGSCNWNNGGKAGGVMKFEDPNMQIYMMPSSG